MKHVVCAAAMLVASAGWAMSATMPGSVVEAGGNTTLAVGDGGTLTLTAASANPAATAIYAGQPGGSVSQFSIDALFEATGGAIGSAIHSFISEGDEPATASGSYALTNTMISFGAYHGDPVYRTFRATFLTPFDPVAAPTVQEVLDALSGGFFTFRIGNDITNGPGGPAANYIAVAAGGPIPAAVPLPAAGWMLLAGAGALAAAGRRRKRS